MTQLPKESNSQEIGRLAGRALTSQMPISWIETPISGDTDFGLDYMMQIKNTNDEVSFNFYLQLKGTMSPTYSADKKFITIDIQLSTIMYYRATEPAVVLAVVDLKNHSGAWHQCPIYYLILEDNFFAQIDGKEDQKSVSVKVPTSNLLNDTLDLLGYFQSRFTEQLAVSGLKKQLSDINMPLAPAVNIITKGLEQKPIYLDSMANPIDAPWVHSPEGSNAAALERSWNLLSSNKVVLAERALISLSQKLDGLSENELAEYHFQMARLLSYQGQDEISQNHYLQAHQGCERPRYKLAYLESLFNSEEGLKPDVLEEIRDSVDINTYQSCFLKAKCMALLGQVDVALNLMDSNYPERQAARLVILLAGEKFAVVDSMIEQVEQLSFHDVHDEYTVLVIAARRLYFAHFAEDTREVLTVPVHGLVTYNTSDMKQAVKHIDRAWSLTEQLPHLPNIEQLIDVSLPVYGYFDRLSQLASHIEAIYQERAKDQSLARSYSRVLWHQQRYDELLSIVQQITEPDDFDLYALVTSTYMTGRKKEALELLKLNEAQLFDANNPSALASKVMGVQWASELLEHKLAKRYSALLESTEEGRACLAMLECEQRCSESPDQRKEHLLHLHYVYSNTGKPIQLALCLMESLDTQDLDSAHTLIELSDRVLLNMELSPAHYLTRARALLTTKNWAAAEELATRKLAAGNRDIAWPLILAASLKAQGRLGESLSVLKRELKLVQLSTEALQFYIEISMSLGLLEDVIGEIKTLYAQATTRQMKVEVLNRLLMVYVQSKAYREDATFALAEYSRLVDQNNEREEGSFLMLSLTIGWGQQETAESKADFRTRLKKYTEQFPDSHILWKESVQVDATPEELIKQFQRIVGTTDDQIKQSEVNTLAIRDGSLPAPFVMRRQLIIGFRDVFSLWYKAQTSPPENLEFKIQHAPQITWTSFEKHTSSGLHLLFDETALLTLYEIGALDAALSGTDRCYVLRSTFNAIRDAHTGWDGSMSAVKARNILTVLHTVLVKITIIEPTDGLANAVAFDLYADAAKQTGAILISDDKHLAWCVSHLHGPVLTANSINLIEYLYQKGKIHSGEQARLVGAFSQLPAIVQLNVRIDYAATILTHCLPQRLYVDFRTTPFSDVLQKILSGNRNSNEIVMIVLKILLAAQQLRSMHPIAILDILEETQRHHQLRTLPEIIALWFLHQCVNTPASSSILYIKDDNKRSLWVTYSEMMNEYAKYTVADTELLIPVIQSLRTIRPEARPHAYAAVESCIAHDDQLLFMMRSLSNQFELYIRLFQSQS